MFYMRIKIVALFLLIIYHSYGQNSLIFNEPLKIIAKDKINSEIKKGTSLIATSISYKNVDPYSVTEIIAKNSDGLQLKFDARKIDLFDFLEMNNVEKIWNKHLLINGTYANLIVKGYQYDLRNELNNESIEYINQINYSERFFEDEYLLDYLYTLTNRIHTGILKDNRPGNIIIKIVKDIEPNAFALPNGCLIISTGLLSTIQSEDELMGILSHEVAHFVLDHHVLNYNREIDRKKRAEFWASFATIIAAGADSYFTVKNNYHIPGLLTESTATLTTIFSEEVLSRLGLKYSREQEIEADKVAKEILKVLGYNDLGLSAALKRIQSYCILTGNQIALSGGGTHPSLSSRMELLGEVSDLEKFTQSNYLKKVSLVNSYNAWLELWYYSHYYSANLLVNNNIENNVATETDYIVKAIIKRRLSNTEESNIEVLNYLNKAKSLNVVPNIIITKEEGITYLRLNRKADAKKSFQSYLASLNELLLENKSNDFVNNEIKQEIMWAKKMIFKSDNL